MDVIVYLCPTISQNMVLRGTSDILWQPVASDIFMRMNWSIANYKQCLNILLMPFLKDNWNYLESFQQLYSAPHTSYTNQSNQLECLHINMNKYIYVTISFFSKSSRRNLDQSYCSWSIAWLLMFPWAFKASAVVVLTEFSQNNPVSVTEQLTHWGLVTSFGDIDLGQHWLR